MRGGGGLPSGFASQLADVLAPGEEARVGALISEAVDLDDGRLAAFLEGLARRISSDPHPVSAMEVEALLRGASPPLR